jgi:hypothetical protein
MEMITVRIILILSRTLIAVNKPLLSELDQSLLSFALSKIAVGATSVSSHPKKVAVAEKQLLRPHTHIRREHEDKV